MPSNKKLILFVGAGLILLIILLAVLFPQKLQQLLPFSQPKQAAFPDILYLTPAVNSFSGKVEKIEGSSLIVSKEIKLDSSSDVSPQKLTYRITTSQNTEFNRFFPADPAGPQSTKPSLKDIKTGDQVTALTTTDLRLLQKREFQAKVVNILPKITSLRGVVTDVKDNTLKVSGTLIIPPVPELFALPNPNKEFEITLNKDTSISRLIGSSDPTNPSKTEKIAASQLTKGASITVFAGSDISSTDKVQAQKIGLGTGELSFPPFNPPVPSGQTITAAPKR